MKLPLKVLALAAALALTSGAAYAMECCKAGKCCCEQMKKDGPAEKPSAEQPKDHSQH